MTATRVSQIVYDVSQLIIRGDLAPDEAIGEAQLAERFGVSRTPVRQALAVLDGEGLVQKAGGRSYRVRRFGHQEILDAIEVRSVLEGLAIRSVAENKSAARVLREFDLCLTQGNEIINQMETKGLGPKLIEQYYVMNSRFHGIVLQGAQNAALTSALEVVSRVPFAAVGALARYKNFNDENSMRRELRYFIYSHMQHTEMVEAVRTGQASRAEQVMRSHAQMSMRNISIHLPDPLADRLPPAP